MAHAIGIDLGTSSCKACVLGENGRVLSTAFSSYPTSSPRAEWYEQDPRDYILAWDAVWNDLSAKLPDLAIGELVVGLTRQMHTLVLLDEYGAPLRPAILWSDRRATRQCQKVRELVPDVATITGNAVLPAFTLPQLLWVKDNEPDIYRRVSHVVQPKDYLGWYLTGEWRTDPSNASGTSMFDIRSNRWSEEILSASAVPEKWLPRCVGSSEAHVLRVGLAGRSGTEVSWTVPGAGDQAAQAVALGVTKPGVLGMTLGTSGVVFEARSEPSIGSFCHAVPGLWLALESMHAAGLSLSWFSEALAESTPLDELLAEAAQAAIGSDGLVFLPFLTGPRSATSGEFGSYFCKANVRHQRRDFVRAIVEGVSFEMRRMAEEVHGGSLSQKNVRVGGGGGRSEFWIRTLASIFGTTVAPSSRDSAFGAAVLAGTARHWWTMQDVVDDARNCAAAPDVAAAAVYQERYEVYLQLCQELGVFG